LLLGTFLVFLNVAFASSPSDENSIVTHTQLFESEKEYQAEIKDLPSSTYYIIGFNDKVGVHTIQRWGILNKQKKVILEFEYDTIIYSSVNEFIVKKHYVAQGQSKKVFGLYHAEQLQLLLETNYSNIESIAPQLYRVVNKGVQRIYQSSYRSFTHPFDAYRFIDTSYIETHTQQIKSLYAAHNLKCIVAQYKNVSLSGTQVEITHYGSFDLFDAFQHKIITKDVLADSILYDTNNNWLIYRNGFYYVRHNYATPTTNKKIRARDNRSYVIDTSISKVIRYVSLMDSIYFESEGYFLVQKDKLYGYCDSAGNTPIAPKYDSLSAWSEGYCAVQFRKKWGYLDKNENLKIQPYYNAYTPFVNGAARVKEGKQWLFINTSGKNINSVTYDTIYPNLQGNYVVIKNKKMGMCDFYGREIIPCNYTHIVDLGFDNYLIQHHEHKKIGVINGMRSTVIPFEYSGFSALSNYSCVWLFNTPLDIFYFNKFHE
jgi:hypothetical protein